MKSFKQFWDEVNEALDNPCDIKWIDKENELIGLFQVVSKAYTINCSNRGDNIWYFKFYVWDNIQNILTP